MKIEKKNWFDVSKDPISIASIRKLHTPHEHYRFTKDGYPAGARFVGTMAVPIVIYVLEGAFKHSIEGDELVLSAGEFAEFDRCNFACDVASGNDVRFVSVIKLPEKLRKSSECPVQTPKPPDASD